MLLLISYRPKAARVETEEKRVLNLFLNWKPPAGVTIKSHYVRADGGGFVISDADSALAAVEGNAPWVAFFDYEVTPIVEIAEGVPALQRAISWRESVR